MREYVANIIYIDSDPFHVRHNRVICLLEKQKKKQEKN